jgi:hypothetical protein
MPNSVELYATIWKYINNKQTNRHSSLYINKDFGVEIAFKAARWDPERWENNTSGLVSSWFNETFSFEWLSACERWAVKDVDGSDWGLSEAFYLSGQRKLPNTCEGGRTADWNSYWDLPNTKHLKMNNSSCHNNYHPSYQPLVNITA